MRYQTIKKGDRLRVVLKGDLNEGIAPKLEELDDSIGTSYAEFDCAEITAVNSIGARHWTEFLNQLSRRTQFEFHKCGVQYVEYASLLPSKFFAKRIASLSIPFQCIECGFRIVPTLPIGELASQGWTVKMSCRDCQGPLTPQVVLEDYLAFLREPG